MLIVRAPDIRSSEITDRKLYFGRREFMRAAGLGGGAAVLGLKPAAAAFTTAKSSFSTEEAPTPKDKITSYNNYYEFGVEKDDPAANAGSLKTAPWSVAIEGECAKPAT